MEANQQTEKDILLKQGAEAKLYLSEFYGKKCIIKQRFSKSYRVKELDQKLTQRRLSQEVRAMAKCRRHGISTPCVYFVKNSSSSIYMEYISDAVLVKDFINENQENTEALLKLLGLMGRVVAKMHNAEIIHGDLTTSNMFYQPASNKLTVIDFGLSFVSSLTEDKGVDLYVLERAFISTHPATESQFPHLLTHYKESCNGAEAVMTKLEDIKARGRKRVMIG